jgi:hypothetical protein
MTSGASSSADGGHPDTGADSRIVGDAGLDASADVATPESGSDVTSPDGATDATTPDGCVIIPFDSSDYVDGGGGKAVIGKPCLPSAETMATFDGFERSEVDLRFGKSGAATCLVDHFQGLVTCPYGQSAAGLAPTCAAPCTTLGGDPVVGAVAPQCVDRPASMVVFWSCRCANAEGKTDDGDDYCMCPATMTCLQTIASLGDAEDDYSGAYCVYGPYSGAACSVTCDPTAHPCP